MGWGSRGEGILIPRSHRPPAIIYEVIIADVSRLQEIMRNITLHLRYVLTVVD